MKKIIIKIADNLTPRQEQIELNKQLNKILLGNNNNTKLLGDGVTIKHKQTEIIIERVTPPSEKRKEIKLLKCFCGKEFASNTGKKLYVNYGGNVRSKLYCSDVCRGVVLSLSGVGRASFTRNGLKSVRNY